MGHVVGVKFREQGQVYYFDARPYVVGKEDVVLVKTEEGVGLGRVVDVRTSPPSGVLEKNLKPLFRLATPDDIRDQKENKALEAEAFKNCRNCIITHSLEMKLVDVEVYFDRSKMVFYFTAPGRIDFRELVKDLVRAYRTRIELRQIGVRHETQMLGAVGNCGQICCCRRFLRKFEPVTIKMAKDQNLFLNPAKISGVCGRLLCCLAYEKDTYVDFQKRLPRMGKKFTTSLGAMRTLRSNIFRDSIVVLTEDNEEREVSLDEWQEIVTSPRRDGGQKPPVKSREAAPASVPQHASPAQDRRKDSRGQGRKPKPSTPPVKVGAPRSGEQARDSVKKKKKPVPAGQAGGRKKTEASAQPQAAGQPRKTESPGETSALRRKPAGRRRGRKKPAQKKPSET